MRLLSDLQRDVARIRRLIEDELGEEEEDPEMTAEEIAERERTQQMARERIAWREAKQREIDEWERKAAGNA